MKEMTTFPPSLTTAVHDVNSTYVNETSLNATAAPLGVTGSRIGGGGAATFYFPWNNPTNVMTQGTSENITTALQCYVFPILTLSGVTGNIMSLIVLFQRKLRDSTTTIVLIGLSFSDMVFLVTNYVRKSTCIIDRYDKMAGDTLTATTFYYMFYLKTAFSRVSTILIVVISAERLIAVAFPFKVKMLVTKPKMIATVLLSYVVTLGALAGLPPQYTYAYIRGKPVISQTQFAKDNAVALKGYNEYFLPIVFRHIPVFVVFILNIVIIVILRRSAQFQKNASSKDDKKKEEQRKITRMLVTVAIVFFLCLLPGDILLMTSLSVEGFQFFGTQHNLFMAISDICLMFEMINANVNFIIFIVLNRKFYNIWMRLFCRCTVPLFKMSVRSAAATSRDTTETSMKTRDHRAFKANLSTGNGSGVFDKNSLAAQEESSVDATAEDGGNANPSFVQE